MRAIEGGVCREGLGRWAVGGGGVPVVGQSGCDPGAAPPRCDRTRLTQRLPAGRPRLARQVSLWAGEGARREWAIAGDFPGRKNCTPPPNLPALGLHNSFFFCCFFVF